MARLGVPLLELPVESSTDVRARALDRAGWMSLVLVLLLGVVGFRVIQLTLWPNEATIMEAGDKRWASLRLQAKRGEILDREGRRLATTLSTPNVFVDAVEVRFGIQAVAEERVRAGEAKSVEDEVVRLNAAAVRDLATLMSLSESDIAHILAGSGRYEMLARGVHPQVAMGVERLTLYGVGIERENRRFYPEEALAAQVLGFVDRSGHGQAGLEKQFDDQLRGGDVLLGRRRDRRGLSVENPLSDSVRDLSVGLAVHTTIDRTLQRATERALAKVMETSKPKSAYAVVVDVRTGDILALANNPAYNPNAVPENPTDQRNHVIQDAIEPGSVYKPFTIAAGLKAGVIQADGKIDCENGFWAVGGSRVHDDHPHGVVSLTEVIKYSSNIASAKVGLQVGATRLIEELRNFGFGSATGIDLPWEAKGKLRDPKVIRTIELANTSFGQGTTATPLQLVMGMAALANGGVRMRPRLVTQVVDAYGVPDVLHRETVAERVVSEEVARQLVLMMETVMEPGGTGTRGRVPGYRVGGKTGTAQKVTDGVYGDARIGSFVGFAPVDDPVIAVAISVDEPSEGSRYGGIVAAPAFAEIVGVALRHLGVPPSTVTDDATGDEAGASTTNARPPVLWAGDGWHLPDLRDLPLRDALAMLEGTGLSIAMSGSGHVVSQDPPPFAVGHPGDTINLRLR